jgi:hypothetical protein
MLAVKIQRLTDRPMEPTLFQNSGFSAWHENAQGMDFGMGENPLELIVLLPWACSKRV